MNFEFRKKEALPMREEVELGYEGAQTVRISNAQASTYAVFELREGRVVLRRSEGANPNTIARWKSEAEKAFTQRDAA